MRRQRYGGTSGSGGICPADPGGDEGAATGYDGNVWSYQVSLFANPTVARVEKRGLESLSLKVPLSGVVVAPLASGHSDRGSLEGYILDEGE
jgi:hypothetical protein